MALPQCVYVVVSFFFFFFLRNIHAIPMLTRPTKTGGAIFRYYGITVHSFDVCLKRLDTYVLLCYAIKAANLAASSAFFSGVNLDAFFMSASTLTSFVSRVPMGATTILTVLPSSASFAL